MLGGNKSWEEKIFVLLSVEGLLVGYICKFIQFMVWMDTLEGELRDESKDGVEAELALEKKFLEIFTQK